MSVKFSVERTVYLPTAEVFVVEGRVLHGNVKAGEVLCIGNDPTRCVKVKSIALVNEREPSETVTLSVEKPSFPMDDLNGSELVSAEFAAAPNDLTEGER